MYKYIFICFMFHFSLNANVFLINNSNSVLNVKVYKEFLFFDYFGASDARFGSVINPKDTININIDDELARIVVYDSLYFNFLDINYNVDTLYLNIQDTKYFDLHIVQAKTSYTKISNYIKVLNQTIFKFDKNQKSQEWKDSINKDIFKFKFIYQDPLKDCQNFYRENINIRRDIINVKYMLSHGITDQDLINYLFKQYSNNSYFNRYKYKDRFVSMLYNYLYRILFDSNFNVQNVAEGFDDILIKYNIIFNAEDEIKLKPVEASISLGENTNRMLKNIHSNYSIFNSNSINIDILKTIIDIDATKNIESLIFWGTWCKPCLDNLDSYRELANSDKAIMIALELIEKDKWIKKIKELGLEKNQYYLKGAGFNTIFSGKYNVNSVPRIFKITR